MNIQFFQTQIHTLSNGLILIHRSSGSWPVSHFGYMIAAGARQDPVDRQGVAHLLEHLIFKGTAQRSSRKIFETFDSFGSELNGYTAKEETCFYFSVPSEHFAQAADLLIDMLLNPQLSPKEIKKEKNVIMDEILSYQDSPSELIFDDFEALLYQHSGIGQSILGTDDSLAVITREDLLRFYHTYYNTANTVLSYVGDLPIEAVVLTLESIFQRYELPAAVAVQQPAVPLLAAAPSCWILPKSTNQAHCILGMRAPCAPTHRLVFELINVILGGAGLSSLLNLHIREKYGYVYTIESQYVLFSDTAYFNIYFGTDQSHWKKVHALTLEQMARLADRQISVATFERQKRQLKGLYLLQSEQASHWMIHQAKQYLLNAEIPPISTVFSEIDEIKRVEIMDLCASYFTPLTISTLVYLEESLAV